MNWWLAAGSLAAVLALAGMAWALKLGGTQRFESGTDAIRLAEALSSGFEGKACVVSTTGELAAVAGGPSDLVLVEPMGARHCARRIAGARIATLDDGPDGSTITLRLSARETLRITVADAAAARAFADTLGG
ncbi:hypothetical protein [Sphingomonas sp. MS122]|uniref:hypothetical protein n=1 Tax=Sphingomonas sp. MS122 TaxID=3412683 RepID=UPI003C2EB4BB